MGENGAYTVICSHAKLNNEALRGAISVRPYRGSDPGVKTASPETAMQLGSIGDSVANQTLYIFATIPDTVVLAA